VLLALRETEGHRMRSSEMAVHIGWEHSRLSHHLGRMERRQLIRREECTIDSRGAVPAPRQPRAVVKTELHHVPTAVHDTQRAAPGRS